MKKQLIGFILPVLICVLTPLEAAAGMTMSHSPWPIATYWFMEFNVHVWDAEGAIEGATVTFSVSPDDGTASVDPTSATTDSNGRVTTLFLPESNASGSYEVTATYGSQSLTGTVTIKTTDPDPVFSISAVSTTTWTGAPGDSFTFTVQVYEDGSPADGETVTFSISPDDGTASLNSTSATTGSNGQASTTLTLGSSASGSYTVTATRGSQSVSGTVTVSTSGQQQENQQQRDNQQQQPIGQSPEKTVRVSTGLYPRTLETSGKNQQGPVGAALDEPFVIVVRDQNGDLFEGAQVAFAVTAGGGTLSVTTATTDAKGQAATTLTLGSDPGTNTIKATVAGFEPVIFTAVGYVIPHRLTKVSGDGQEGPASTQLDEPFVVLVSDEEGAAMVGVAVTFSVTAGGGMLSSTTDTNSCIFKLSQSSITATTDANGQASTRLTLGSEPGTNTVSATVEGLEPEPFTATAAEQVMPHRLKICGDDQEGTVGALLTEPLVVSVSDEGGAAMAGVVVSFAVTAGGGTLSSATATTDANGRARTWLTLGSDLGTNMVSATVEGLASVTFTATGQEDPLASLFDTFLGGGKRVALPDSPQLAQNAPNPFNSQTVLSYFLPIAGPAHLAVFSLTGQRVAVLHQGPQQAGYHRLRWNGRDDAGRSVASGIYLYRLVTDEGILTRKLTLLR